MILPQTYGLFLSPEKGKKKWLGRFTAHKIFISKFLKLKWADIFGYNPSSIYSCSIDYFLEHEICHLGCLGRNKKFLKRPNFCLSMQLFRVVFSTFWLSIEQLYIELGYFSVRIQKLHNIAGLSEAGGPGGLSYKLKIGYHSRFFGRKS